MVREKIGYWPKDPEKQTYFGFLFGAIMKKQREEMKKKELEMKSRQSRMRSLRGK